MIDAPGILLAFALLGLAVSAFARWLPLTLATLAVAVIEGHLGVLVSYGTEEAKIALIDVLAVIAALAGAVRLLLGQRLPGLALLWCIAIAMLLLSFVRGIDGYGFATAAIFYRRFFYISAFGLYILSFPLSGAELERFSRVWIGVGILLAATAVLFWIDPDFIPAETLDGEGTRWQFDRLRVLPASSALLIAEAALFTLAGSTSGRDLLRPTLAIALLLLVGLLYHRSVWLAAMAGIVILVGLHGGRALRFAVPFAIGGVAVLALWAIVQSTVGLDFLAAPLSDAILEPFSDDSSIAWRAQGWEALLSRVLSGGPLSILFGGGFGIGYERFIDFQFIQVSPHNMYMEILVNGGVIAVASWLLFHAAALLLALGGGGDAEGAITGRAAAALLAATLVFSLSYTLPIEQGLLLGMLARVVLRVQARPAMPAMPAAAE